VEADDLDRHMAANGQAAANAGLVSAMLERVGLSAGSRVLFPGAGTGQLLDFLPAAPLRALDLTFTDINAAFLDVLRRRIEAVGGLTARVVVDDAERPAPGGRFEAVVTVLVLEHVAWGPAVEALAALCDRWLAFVIQRNDGDPAMVATTRELAPSIARFRAIARPRLVPEPELTAAVEREGLRLAWRSETRVPDAKAMIGLLYER
jgi:hypothetical protein